MELVGMKCRNDDTNNRTMLYDLWECNCSWGYFFFGVAICWREIWQACVHSIFCLGTLEEPAQSYFGAKWVEEDYKSYWHSIVTLNFSNEYRNDDVPRNETPHHHHHNNTALFQQIHIPLYINRQWYISSFNNTHYTTSHPAFFYSIWIHIYDHDQIRRPRHHHHHNIEMVWYVGTSIPIWTTRHSPRYQIPFAILRSVVRVALGVVVGVVAMVWCRDRWCQHHHHSIKRRGNYCPTVPNHKVWNMKRITIEWAFYYHHHHYHHHQYP